MKATYVRVSTVEQNISYQLKGKEGEVYWIIKSLEDRENTARLLADATKRQTDEVEVHSMCPMKHF